METPQEIVIKADRHLIIHGQLGNLQAKINQLEHMLKATGQEVFLPYLEEIEIELTYLKSYYPQLDGGFEPAVVRPEKPVEPTNSPKINQAYKNHLIKNALRDMRVLMDAARLSFQHEGNIDCHLKIMLDEAWGVAAEQVGLDNPDHLPF